MKGTSESTSDDGIRSREGHVSDVPRPDPGGMLLSSERALGSLLADESATGIFLAWEKLRVLYNLTLACVVVSIIGNPFRASIEWTYLIQGVVTANILFCAGPCAEGYLTLLGANRHLARAFLFISGLLLSSFLVWVSFVPQMP